MSPADLGCLSVAASTTCWTGGGWRLTGTELSSVNQESRVENREAAESMKRGPLSMNRELWSDKPKGPQPYGKYGGGTIEPLIGTIDWRGIWEIWCTGRFSIGAWNIGACE